jgi:hypothetical protein
MNRADFQQLAEEYGVEAKTLLDAGHFVLERAKSLQLGRAFSSRSEGFMPLKDQVQERGCSLWLPEQFDTTSLVVTQSRGSDPMASLTDTKPAKGLVVIPFPPVYRPCRMN